MAKAKSPLALAAPVLIAATALLLRRWRLFDPLRLVLGVTTLYFARKCWQRAVPYSLANALPAEDSELRWLVAELGVVGLATTLDAVLRLAGG